MMITAIMLGCRADEDIQTFDFSGDWKVSSFVDLKTSEIIIKTEENTWNQLNNADNIIRFEKTDATKGVVSGINVTNSFYGVYTTDAKKKISITNVAWTKINEPEWGKLFHSITDAEAYEIKNSMLTIYYSDGTKCIRFERVDNK